MTQTIIAALVGLLAGFGLGNMGSGADMDANYQNQMQRGQSAEEMPLSDDYLSMRPQVTAMAMEDLSTEEEEGLVFMREEEKLARDVYLKLYEKWGTPVFNNIAQSEQTHTESVKQLLDKYGLTDPVTDDAVGVFENEDLAALYKQLVARGEESLEEALRVGALIEDLDIKDLEDQLAITDNEDLTLVYNNLQRGSRNHMRSFVGQLEKLGETYEPEYISQEEFESIISSDRETGGNTGGRGWGGNHSGSGGQGMMDGSGQGQGGNGGGRGH